MEEHSFKVSKRNFYVNPWVMGVFIKSIAVIRNGRKLKIENMTKKLLMHIMTNTKVIVAT